MSRVSRLNSFYNLALITYAVLGGAALGLYSAFWIIESEQPFGRQQAGPWSVWPQIGSRDIDPYTRAVLARTGEIPLAAGEGLAFEARLDSAGRPLDRNCIYEITGTTPSARYWTLSIYGSGHDSAVPDRQATTSSAITRGETGGYSLTVSPVAQPGNWLKPPSDDARFEIIMRFYDTPASGTLTRFSEEMMPRITRTGCLS
jgi:hypothetical protein